MPSMKITIGPILYHFIFLAGPCSTCHRGVEVYYNTVQEYDHEPLIFGYYSLQNDLINSRPYFKKGPFAIWWDGDENWFIGNDRSKGHDRGYAYVKRDVFCVHTITDWNWKWLTKKGDWRSPGKALGLRAHICISAPGNPCRNMSKNFIIEFTIHYFNRIAYSFKSHFTYKICISHLVFNLLKYSTYLH